MRGEHRARLWSPACFGRRVIVLLLSMDVSSQKRGCNPVNHTFNCPEETGTFPESKNIAPLLCSAKNLSVGSKSPNEKLQCKARVCKNCHHKTTTIHWCQRFVVHGQRLGFNCQQCVYKCDRNLLMSTSFSSIKAMCFWAGFRKGHFVVHFSKGLISLKENPGPQPGLGPMQWCQTCAVSCGVTTHFREDIQTVCVPFETWHLYQASFSLALVCNGTE